MKRVYQLYYVLVYPFFWLFYRTHCIGRENLPEGPMILCASHSAYSDPVLIAFSLGFRRHPRFMAKQELLDLPVLGWLLKKIGVFGVRRGAADIGAIKTAIQILREGGTVALFPEGTRVSEDDAGAAKTGAIMLASRTGAPIVPMYVPRKKRLFSRVTTRIGSPYTIPRLKNGAEAYDGYAVELMEKIRALGREAP